MLLRSICFAGLTIFATAKNSASQDLPAFYTIPEITLSPDHRFGVTVPKLGGADQLKDPKNQIIEVKTGRVLGIIQSDRVAYDRMNEGGIVPAIWSVNDTRMLWQVDGKWGFNAIVLLSFDEGKVTIQANLLNLLRKEVLKRTHDALPEKYEAVKKQGEGNGSWWQDGFAIDCVFVGKGGPLTFPLIFQIFLSSDPKDDSSPAAVNSRMTAEIKSDGKLQVDDFHIGASPPSRTWD